MALIENETRTRQGTCPTHGRVTAQKQVPKIKFPFVISGIARGRHRDAPVPLPGVRIKGVTACSRDWQSSPYHPASPSPAMSTTSLPAS